MRTQANTDKQLTFFGTPSPAKALPMPPHQAASPTSRTAADRVRHKLSSRLASVVAALRQQGGMTRHEIADECDLLLQSVCSVVNVGIKRGVIERTKQRRNGREVVVAGGQS